MYLTQIYLHHGVLLRKYNLSGIQSFHAARGLEKHPDDGHHRKSSVSKLRRKLFRLLSRVAGGQHLESEITCCSWCSGRLVLRNLAEGHVGQDPGSFSILFPYALRFATQYTQHSTCKKNGCSLKEKTLNTNNTS